MDQKLSIIGICGSLRKNSFNKMLLTVAGKILPEDIGFTIADISDVPLFNEDLENPLPNVVSNLKRMVESADGLLISTPEYNSSISGVLKNVLDWLSRPPMKSSLNEKPIAIIGASMGMFGTTSAQNHLRQITSFLNMYTVNQPRVQLAQAHTKFDAEGNLTDPIALELLQKLTMNLVDLAQHFKK